MVLGEMDVAQVNPFRFGQGQPPVLSDGLDGRFQSRRPTTVTQFRGGGGDSRSALTRWMTPTRPGLYILGVGGMGDAIVRGQKEASILLFRFIAAVPHHAAYKAITAPCFALRFLTTRLLNYNLNLPLMILPSPRQRSGSRAARTSAHSSRQNTLLLTDGSSVPLRGTATAMTRNSSQRNVTDDNAHKVGRREFLGG